MTPPNLETTVTRAYVVTDAAGLCINTVGATELDAMRRWLEIERRYRDLSDLEVPAVWQRLCGDLTVQPVTIEIASNG